MLKLRPLHKKMEFSIKGFFSKCDQNPQFSADLVTEEIFNGKLHFLCSRNFSNPCDVKFISKLNLSIFFVFRYRSSLRL